MRDRVERLQNRMRELDLQAFFFSAPTSLRYLFGFTGSNGMGLITSDLSFFATDWRYREQAGQEVKDAQIVIAYRDLIGALKQHHPLSTGQRAGFEEHHLTYSLVMQLRKHHPRVRLVPTEQMVARLAVSKNAEEQAWLRQAAHIACTAWQRLLPLIKPGLTEMDLAMELIYQARKCGSEAEPFEPIIASGPRSALPHARSSRRKLAAGDMVVIDFGCVVNGYASDFTRTVALGDPGAELRHAYRAVQEAGALAREEIRPNLKARALDAIVRRHLEKYGLADYFNHSLGHGLGLEVHSLPRIGPESTDEIPAAAVLAIEPGVYLPGVGGIRIEDDILVTAAGAEVLTPAARDLICVE